MSKAVTTITGPLDLVRKAAYAEGEPQFDYDRALRKFTPQMLGNEDFAIFADMDSSGIGLAWEADIGDLCSTEQWLKKYSLRHYRLDLDCILGSIGFRHSSDYEKIVKKPVCSRYAEGLFSRYTTPDGRAYNVIATRDKLHQYETRLVNVINLYSRRLDWLTTESRRTFGVITENNICLVLNLCTANSSLFSHYLAIVRAVLRQQASSKARLNLIRSSDIVDCWRPVSVPVTKDALEAAISWLDTLTSGEFSSATAVAEAVMQANEDKRLDAIYLFTGGDDLFSAREILLQQARLMTIPINVVAFNVFEEGSIAFLRELAATARGRFHAYTINWCVEDFDINPALLATQKPTPQMLNNPVVSKRYLYGGVPPGAGVREDVFRLYEEIEMGKNNLAVVQTILRDLPETQLAQQNLEKERQRALRRARQNEETFATAEEYMSSKDWLLKYGIRTRKLDLYDVLAGVAFRHCDGVVDVASHPGVSAYQTDAIIHQKLVNARYCNKFAHLRWRDGSLVHVQVTGEIHRHFMEALKVAIDAIQKRIAWLKSGSRELFGSILENQVYIVLDTSASMAPSIKFVKDKIFQLMQEQLRHKTKFNFVAFNTKVYAWKSRLAPVCEETLRNAWQWMKQLECTGSTNTMAALDYALGDPETEAVYLLTDGRPDQPGSAVIAQATHRRILPVHTISFNCHDAEANQFLAELARVTNGRFHAFSSSGDIIVDPISDEPEPWESEDVKVLKQELGLAREYADTMTQLRKECIALAWNKDNTQLDSKKAPYQPQIIGAMLSNHYNGGAKNNSSFLDKQLSRSQTVPPEYAFRPQPDRMVQLVKRTNGKPNIARHTKTSILRLVKEDRVGSPGRDRSSSPPVVLGLKPTYLSGGSSGDDDVDYSPRRRVVKQQPTKQLVRVSSASVGTTKGGKRHNHHKRSVQLWLARHGLTAKHLTAVDVIAPLMFALHRKIASASVASSRPSSSGGVRGGEFDGLMRIMDEIMPATSPRYLPGSSSGRLSRNVDNDYIDFENLGESLRAYENDLVKAVDKFEKHLSRMVWFALDERDRHLINQQKPNEFVPFRRYRSELMPALDRSGWKRVNEHDVNLLEKEIETAMCYLKQCRDFQQWLNQRHPSSASRPLSSGGKQDVINAAVTPRSDDGSGSRSKRRSKRPQSAVVGSPVSRNNHHQDRDNDQQPPIPPSAMYGSDSSLTSDNGGSSESESEESSSDHKK